MTIDVRGYAALPAREPLVPHRFARRDPRPDDVVIEILYCGICHTAIHHARNDWGRANYPLAPGHEIVGRVTAVSRDVTRFKPGDHVGVGCMVDSCRQCPACQDGDEQYCAQRPTLTYNGVDRHDGMRCNSCGLGLEAVARLGGDRVRHRGDQPVPRGLRDNAGAQVDLERPITGELEQHAHALSVRSASIHAPQSGSAFIVAVSCTTLLVTHVVNEFRAATAWQNATRSPASTVST